MCGCSVLFGGVLRCFHKRLLKACFSSPGLAAVKVTWMSLAFVSSVHMTSCMFVTMAPAQPRGASTNFLPHSLVPSVPQPLNELSKQVSAGIVNMELDSRVCSAGLQGRKVMMSAHLPFSCMSAKCPAPVSCILSLLSLHPSVWHVALRRVIVSWRPLPLSGGIHLTCELCRGFLGMEEKSGFEQS